MKHPARRSRVVFATVALVVLILAAIGIWMREPASTPKDGATLHSITIAQFGDFFLLRASLCSD